MVDTEQRIVIVGGGIAGLSSAWFLQKEGFSRVTLIERDVNTTMEASGLNSGLIRHYHPDPTIRSDLIRSVELLSTYQEIFGGSFFEQFPSLWRFHSGDFQEVNDSAHDLLGMNTLSPEQVPPSLKPDDSLGTKWATFENDGLLDSVRLGDRIHRDVEQSGVHIRTSSMLESGEKQDDTWVLTLGEGDELPADRIVNAAGAWANDVGIRLGLDPRNYTPVRRHLFYITNELLPDSYSYYMDYSNRIFFRHVEEGTLISYCDEEPVEPGKDASVDFPEDHLEQVMSEPYPDLDIEGIEQYWSGTYAMTPDRTPIIDTDSEEASVIWATGMNDYGMSYGFRIGERVVNQLQPGGYTFTP